MPTHSARDVIASRRALYELAREIPMRRLAPLLGVSDGRLGTIYGQHEIPHPDRGDWARERHGRIVRRPQLRHAPAGAPETVRFGGHPTARDAGGRDHQLVALLARDAEAPRMEILHDLRRGHPLARRGAKASERAPYLGAENLPRAATDYIMSVPKLQTPRARRFLSALFFALEERGIAVVFDRSGARPVVTLDLLGVRIDLRLDYYRIPRRPPYEPPRRNESASGDEPDRDLVLTVTATSSGRRRRWGGLGNRIVENALDQIPPTLIALAVGEREAPSGAPRRE